MMLSSDARTLLFGIWCHAWDDGVFEWKPIQLKVKVFPYNDVSITSLLEELEEQNLVQRFHNGGKDYAVVKNFQKYQRPKKPSVSGLLPDELRTYAGCKDEISEEVPNQYGTGGEKSPQKGGREEGRKEEEEGIPPNPQEGAEKSNSKKSTTRFVQIEKPDDVSEQLWNDFIALRRQKKAAITKTAMAAFVREAGNANLTLSQVLTLTCERGWQGFKADWLKPGDIPKPQLAYSNEKIPIAVHDEPELFDKAISWSIQHVPGFTERPGQEVVSIPAHVAENLRKSLRRTA